MYCDANDSNYIIESINMRQINKSYSVKGPETGSLEPFKVTWKELTYRVPQKGWFKTKRENIILNNISGYFKSGHITAILGPSGSGKSSLLGCISGQKKTGLSGSITISTSHQVNFAFVAQDDYLFDKLKIRESLMYSSKLKNSGAIDHSLIANNVLKQLNIEECAHIRPNMCSGGQKKRISIALELVSRPNILILDEPTSGLDTVTTWQMINTLIELTKETEPVAVVVTIHQPSAKLFNLFNLVYIMSYDGKCIYHGSPQKMVQTLSHYGLNCPEFHNPSDFVLEVASKQLGITKVIMLSSVMQTKYSDIKEHQNLIKRNYDYKTLSHIWTLTLRSFKLTIRDPFMLPIRVFGYILNPILISIVYGSESGKYSGCPQDFIIPDKENFVVKYTTVHSDIFENLALLSFFCMFGWFGAIFPVILTIPKEIKIFFKEYGNGWYSCFSYFMSKVISDIPFQLIIPNLSTFTLYYMTGQYNEDEWRVYYFAFIFTLISFNSSSLGLMISACLVDYPTAAAFVGCFSIFPMLLLSGFLSRYPKMPTILKWISFVNYYRFGLESTVVDIYGFGRCGDNSVLNRNKTDWTQIIPKSAVMQIYASDKINTEVLLPALNDLTGENYNNTESMSLTHLHLKDSDLYFGIVMLFVMMIFYKVLTYLFILRKVRSST